MKDEKKKPKVLLVDDDLDVLDLLEYNLIAHGYKVKCVSDPDQVLELAIRHEPDLIVLDVVIPPTTGFAICQELRRIARFENTPVFFLTAKTESYVFQLALENGGDDLIYKTLGIQTLLMKIDAVLKEGWVIRKRVQRLELGTMVLDRKHLTVKVHSKNIPLVASEFELLFWFGQNPSRTVTSKEILGHIAVNGFSMITGGLRDLIVRIIDKVNVDCITEISDDHYRLNKRILHL